MFVYGVRVPPTQIPVGSTYIGGHNLVIFPSHTRPSSLEGSQLSRHFWSQVQQLIEAKCGDSFEVDLEQPYIEDQKECAVLEALQAQDPLVKAAWYYIPESNPQTAIIPESGPLSEVD
jgi:hypothetical protein